MIDKNCALQIANNLGIKFNNFSLEDFMVGLNIELEHGLINPITNVTNDDLILTGKIALAHLTEYPNYYNPYYGLPAFENMLKTKN